MSIMLLSYDINVNTYCCWCDDDDAHGSSDFTADIIDAIIGVDKSVELSVIRAMTSAAVAAAAQFQWLTRCCQIGSLQQ